jgi:hypothetical protein
MRDVFAVKQVSREKERVTGKETKKKKKSQQHKYNIMFVAVSKNAFIRDG